MNSYILVVDVPFSFSSNHSTDTDFNQDIVRILKGVLDDTNPYVQQYRCASELLSTRPSVDLKLCLINSRFHDGRQYNIPTASEVAALIIGDQDAEFGVRDIVVESKAGPPRRINELHACYLPLQYPLLFPYGEDGYRDDIQHRKESLQHTKRRKRLSIREFFAYRLMNRENEVSLMLNANRLLQQLIVDGYTMMESQRLMWVKTHQKDLRAELYSGLADAADSGVFDASSTGKKIILPSSFTGGARYMMQNYQDAMAICRWSGYPDLFLTFTCNPAWPEIKRFCIRYNVAPSDRPDILTRIFKIKLRTLLKKLKDEKIFGTIQSGRFRFFICLYILLYLNIVIVLYGLFANS